MHGYKIRLWIDMNEQFGLNLDTICRNEMDDMHYKMDYFHMACLKITEQQTHFGICAIPGDLKGDQSMLFRISNML